MNVYESVTNRIIAQLEAGVIPWRKEWKTSGTHGLPFNHVTGKQYRGINILLLMTSGFADARWMTYKQAQDVGANVRKGEHGTKIVFWSMFDVERETKDGGTEADRVPFMREYTVFNYEQIDGFAQPLPFEENPFEPIPAAHALADSYLTRAGIQLAHGGDRACYHPALDSIKMPNPGSFTNPDAYYSTLFHEMGHSTGHKSRLDRSKDYDFNAAFGSADYSKEELVAEFTAAFLCGTVGISNDRVEANHAAYIQSWLKSLRNDSKMVVSAAQKAQRAADLIQGVTFEQTQQLAA